MMRPRNVSTATVMTQITEMVGPNHAIAPMIIPPDGGWGWVIVIVGLLGSCLTDGFIYSFFLFRESMSKELNIKEADISYLSSLICGFYFVGALLACSFGNQWGFRITTILGAAVTSLSYASGYFYHEMIYYYVIVGVIGGLGSGFMSIGACLPSSFYFDKKRSIALGIVAAGSGLGGLVIPRTVKLFMSYYGWRNTYLFEGGMATSLIFLGVLIRPLKPVMVVINPAPSVTTLKQEDSVMDFSAFKIPPVLPPDMFSQHSMTRSVVDTNPYIHPTILQMAEDVDLISIRVRENTNPSIITRLHEMSVSRRPSQIIQPSASNIQFNNIHVSEDPLVHQRLPWYKCGCCRGKSMTLPERPLLRTDLYYTGSLLRLNEYTGRDKDLDYHMQVTRVPTFYQTVQDMTRSYTTWCCHNFFIGLGYLINYKLFKSLAFTCLAFCGFSVYLAFYLPYVFTKVHLEESGSGNSADNLVSLLGLGSMIGRLSSGIIITKFPRFGAREVASFMTFLSGVTIVGMVLNDNIYFKGLCFFVFGYTIGFYVPLRSLIIVDYFGLENLTSATGVLILSAGFGSFLGPVIGELSMDYTDSRKAPFYVCGISLFLGSIALWPMKKLKKWEDKRAARKKLHRRAQNNK